jgi:hypothetical protein
METTMNRFISLAPGETLRWLLTGWPAGDLEIELYLTVDHAPNGRPAIVVDLEQSIVPENIFLFPMFETIYRSDYGNILYLSADNEGLTAQVGNDRFLLFRPHGSLIPKMLAVLDLGPLANSERYAGIITYENVLGW